MELRLGLTAALLASCGPQHTAVTPPAPTDDHVQESATWKRLAPGEWVFAPFDDAPATSVLYPGWEEHVFVVVDLPEGATAASLTAIEAQYVYAGTGTFRVYPLTGEPTGVPDGDPLATLEVTVGDYQVWSMDSPKARYISTSFHAPVAIDAPRFQLVFDSMTGGPAIAATDADSNVLWFQPPEAPIEKATYSMRLRLRFTGVH
jgi:hypothetical protein